MKIHVWFLNHKVEFLRFAISRAISRWEEASGIKAGFGRSLNSEKPIIDILKFFNFWFRFELNPRICEVLAKCFRKSGNIFHISMTNNDLFEILFDISNFSCLNEFALQNKLWSSGDINFTDFCIADWFKNKDNPGTILPWKEAKSWVYRMNNNKDKGIINESVETLITDSPLGYTPQKLKHAETFLGTLAQKTDKLHKVHTSYSISESMVPEKFRHDSHQKAAFVGIVTMLHKVILIQGGPGTGKTEIGIEALIYILRNGIASKCVWLSPTHAARKMAKKRFLRTVASTAFPDIPFKTIHSYIVSRETHKFIFVDELSMVDSILLYRMMQKNTTASYIFMGDYNQLMPIDRGTPFYDFINRYESESLRMEGYKIYLLQNNYRSSGASIPSLCLRILELGSTIEELVECVSQDEVKYCHLCDDTAISSCIRKFKENGYFPDSYASFHNFDSVNSTSVSNFRIIVATNEEVRKYNQIVKKIFWPMRKPLDGFAKDDILVCNMNITNLIYNGDFVSVFKITKKSITVILNEPLVSLTPTSHDEINIYGPYSNVSFMSEKYWIHILDCNKLEISYYIYQKIFTLAYVSTVHKAQGSEQDHVMIISCRNCILHTIQWIYTAISRAKLCIYIFMPETVINRMILREANIPKTLLHELLKQ